MKDRMYYCGDYVFADDKNDYKICLCRDDLIALGDILWKYTDKAKLKENIAYNAFANYLIDEIEDCVAYEENYRTQ